MSKYQPEDDDVDEFLYGSAKEEETTGSNKAPAGQPADVDAKDTKADSKQEDDEELYQLYRGSSANETQDVGTRQDMEVDDTEIRQESTEIQEDEDSDDDLEIILEPEEPAQRPQSTEASSSPTTGEKSSTLVNLKPGQQSKAAASSSFAAQGSSSANMAGGTANQNPAPGGINLEAIGEYNGQPITEVDLDSFEDKPWRKPGADITDYFNYGFNEMTWRAYCTQQKMMRESKKMMGDMNMNMNDFMAMSMMMPPGAMMDGSMPMGMPGMPNPMMGMPPMGMPPPMGMGNSPNAQRTGAGRGQSSSSTRSGQNPMQQGRSPAGNMNNGNNDQEGNGPMNNPFFWPQMQPPFFPG